MMERIFAALRAMNGSVIYLVLGLCISAMVTLVTVIYNKQETFMRDHYAEFIKVRERQAERGERFVKVETQLAVHSAELAATRGAVAVLQETVRLRCK